jgi:hypothetical protein
MMHPGEPDMYTVDYDTARARMRDEHPWFCRVFPDLMEKLIDQEIDVGWVQAKRVRHGLRPWADEQIDGFYAQLYRPRMPFSDFIRSVWCYLTILWR